MVHAPKQKRKEREADLMMTCVLALRAYVFPFASMATPYTRA